MRIAGVLIAAGVFTAMALFCTLQCFVYLIAGHGAMSFLWLGAAALAVLAAVWTVAAAGPRGEADDD